MSLEQKLNVIDSLCVTDRQGVVSRLPAPARRQAEQLVCDNPRLSIPDLLPRIPVEEPLLIPTL